MSLDIRLLPSRISTAENISSQGTQFQAALEDSQLLVCLFELPQQIYRTPAGNFKQPTGQQVLDWVSKA